MTQSHDPHQGDKSVGAYSVGGRKRRAGWLIPLLALLGVVVAGSLVWALLHNRDSSDKTAAVPATTASFSSTPTGAAVPTPTGTAGTGIAGAGAGVGAGAAALVGGGGTAAQAATGAQAGPGQLGAVLFATDSAALTPDARKVINRAAAAIKSRNGGTVTVTGYADVVGGQPVNNQLTQQRADAVRAALEQSAGSSAVSYVTASKGAADPVASNSTAAGRAQNRRATITLAS